MVIKDNILNLKENVYQYFLADLHERKFPVYYSDGHTIILNYRSQPIEEMLSLKDVASIRYQFYLESKEDIKNIVKKYE